jgi:hypothetical protein
MALGAVLGVLVDVLPDLAGHVGVRDGSVLAKHAHPADAFLLADVLDDPVDDRGLVLHHREAGAALDHLRQLRHVGDHRLQLLAALLAHQQGDEQHHGRPEHEGQVETDFELEAFRRHCGLFWFPAAGRGGKPSVRPRSPRAFDGPQGKKCACCAHVNAAGAALDPCHPAAKRGALFGASATLDERTGNYSANHYYTDLQ